MARGERKAIIPPLPTFTTKESRRFERYATSTEQEVPIRLSYSKSFCLRNVGTSRSLKPKTFSHVTSTLPDFHPQRAIHAEGFYGFDEASKQDVQLRRLLVKKEHVQGE